MTLFASILTDKCLQNHSAIYHLRHPIDKCISEENVCSVDFAKVLRPIKLARNININEKTYILNIRKRFNNRNAAGAFRKRENDIDTITECEISELKAEKEKLKLKMQELTQQRDYFKSKYLSYQQVQNEFTDSDSDINITSPTSFDFSDINTTPPTSFDFSSLSSSTFI